MSRPRILVALVAFALAAPATAAEPLPPELNLIPREAGAFVSFRVGDLWSDARIKPLRDFLTADATVLRDFRQKNGFGPEDIERVTVLMPGFDERRGPSEPWLVVTFKKQADLAGLLDAWDGLSPAEARRAEFDRPMTKSIKVESKTEVKELFPPPPPAPKFNEEKLPPLPRFDGPKGSLLPGRASPFQPVVFLADKDDADPPAKERRKRDLNANYYILRDRGFLIPINERTVVVGFDGGLRDGSAVHELLAALLRRSDDGPLTLALEAAAGKHAIVAGLNLRAVKNALPRDGWVEALPLHSILGSRSATLTLDLGEEIKMALRVDAPDAATAKRVHDILKALHTLGLEMLPGLKKLAEAEDSPAKLLLMVAEPMLRDATFEQKESAAVVSLTMKADAAWAKALTEAIAKTHQTAERMKSMNNLKQMALAVHNYHDAMGRFPFPGGTAPKGNPQGALPDPKPNLSWRVLILPYIEQANLYNQFRFDEPWDSAHNKALIPLMPKIYAPPSGVDAPKGHTFYRMFTGPNTFSEARSFINITDGTSNTIMILEAGESVPWTKPDEMPLGAKLPKLGGHFKGKMIVAMGDGSVRMIDLNKISDTTLRAAITTNGGEVLGSDW
jgi:hypothetical protein